VDRWTDGKRAGALFAVPPGVVTKTEPDAVFAAIVAVIIVSLTTVKLVAAVVLNFTEVVPVRPEPRIVTVDPAVAFAGEKDATCGIIQKLAEVVSVPCGVATVIGPVVVPAQRRR
jgi:hypothetical protein